ncbi:MAG: DNA repair protein RecO [Gammaproteobacteria bacterium]|nr:DNA repair protein RecO [Gammaproteobacteria bacterium]MDH5777199.1 DNA repair protein RecO [Gammaproteobacteria bacterium]
MSSNRIQLHSAYILHTRAYQDTSIILDVFTQEYGRISVLAKGAKQAKSKFNGMLQVFNQLLLSWSGRGEMYTLTGAEHGNKPVSLKGESLLSGFYVNELLLKLTQRHDPHPELFEKYHQLISELGGCEKTEPLLRRFECYLIQEAGYGMILDHDVETGESVQDNQLYNYYFEKGPVRLSGIPNNEVLTVKGSTLLALQCGEFADDTVLREAKQIMRAIINHRLDGKIIKTRELNLHKVL